MAITKVIKETNQIIAEIADQYYRGVYNGYKLQDIYRIVKEELLVNLRERIDLSLYNTKSYNTLVTNLENFAAGKSIRQWNKMLGQLGLNTLPEFVKSSKVVNALYNDTYLHTEMNYINNSIGQLNKWTEYDRLGDSYMIRYVATHDSLTRASHMMLDGTILPSTDGFWSIYTPPIDYNCRCTTKAVRFNPATMGTQLSESQDLSQKIGNIKDFNVPKGLVGNVKMSGEFFTDGHPYMKVPNLLSEKRLMM